MTFDIIKPVAAQTEIVPAQTSSTGVQLFLAVDAAVVLLAARLVAEMFSFAAFGRLVLVNCGRG